jgi:signal transduction histidine kinase
MTNDEMDVKQALKILDLLAQVDQELGGNLDLQNILERTQRWAQQGVSAECAWVFLRENETVSGGGWLCFPAEIPEPGSFVEHDAVLRDVFSGGAPVFSAAGSGQSERLVVPVSYADHPIGLILVERPQTAGRASIGEPEKAFLVSLANRAAAAINNARLSQEIERVNQAKAKFVSVVTHELRIPMTSIKGYTDLLRTGVVGPVNDQQRSFLEVIRNNVERMSALVSDLSDISRAETGRLKLNCKWFALADVLDEVVRNLQPKIDDKGHSLELHIPPELPRVHADMGRTAQIITTLLSNAIKYTPSKGMLQVSAVMDDRLAQDDLVRLEVADKGIGISPDDQAKVFSQFFRSEDPLVREEQGWGLGLTVAKLLAERMGGAMGFTSELKHGSTFWFTMPTKEMDCDS